MQRIAGAVEMFDELRDAALVFEVTTFSIAFIQKRDADAAVEKREFLKTLVERVEAVLGDRKDFARQL